MTSGSSFGAPFGAKGNVSQGASVGNLSAMGNDVMTQLANAGAGVLGGPFDVHSTGAITNDTGVNQQGHSDSNETVNFAPQSGGGL